MAIRPESIGCRPARVRSTVVLPAPLGPSRATTSPAPTAEVEVEVELAELQVDVGGRGS